MQRTNKAGWPENGHQNLRQLRYNRICSRLSSACRFAYTGACQASRSDAERLRCFCEISESTSRLSSKSTLATLRAFSLLISTTEHRARVLAGPRIELGTERESLLQVLDEDAYFGGDPAACRPNGQNRYCSLKGCQQRNNSTFS